MGRERAHRFCQPVAQILSTAVSREMHEDDEARGPFDQCGDGGPAASSND